MNEERLQIIEEKILTTSEKEIMELLWEVNKPLSGTDIVSLSENKSWKESYIHLLINSLLRKDMIKIDGFVKTTKNYARTFVPTLTEEEYSVRQITRSGTFKTKHIPYIVGALLAKTTDTEIVLALEKIVADKKKKLKI
ncbi:MAG: BlaI/MecI/CopY family transcriptional regulator [Oscillospiraceae bacterium]